MSRRVARCGRCAARRTARTPARSLRVLLRWKARRLATGCNRRALTDGPTDATCGQERVQRHRDAPPHQLFATRRAPLRLRAAGRSQVADTALAVDDPVELADE